jgi:hypothetical protein
MASEEKAEVNAELNYVKNEQENGHQWLMLVIQSPSYVEVEIRRIEVRGQPRQVVHEAPSLK